MLALVAGLVGLAALAAGCTSGDGRPASDAGPTTVAGDPGTTVEQETVSTWPRSPASPVPLPSLPPPQSEPTGYDPRSEASAATVRGCAAAGDCVGVDAALVVWPGADLTATAFGQATLTGADLRGADGSGGEFPVANLSGADLTGANFQGANLSGADLTGATLIGTDFSGADLTGADLSDAIADGAEFRGAVLCRTVMPDRRIRDDDC